MIVEPLEVNEECGSCGADIGPSSTFPWHGESQDCRDLRSPILEPTVLPDRDYEGDSWWRKEGQVDEFAGLSRQEESMVKAARAIAAWPRDDQAPR